MRVTRDRKNLEVLFRPKSVAIIGASNRYHQISGRPLKFFLKHGYKGRLYPINPKYDNLLEVKCYPALKDIENHIDLALITLPSDRVPDTVKACIEKGVGSIIIFSSGFAEIGPEGKRSQEELRKLIVSSNTVALGPNCLGFVNLYDRVTATFGGSLEYQDNVLLGNVGFLSQSGALSNIYFSVAQKMKIGFSFWIATGNEMDIDFCDCLEYLIDDERTQVVVCLIEGLRDGRKFMQIAKKGIEKQKPIIVFKIGRSKMGRKASLSHTGAMAGSDEVYEAAFKQAGMIRIENIEEVLDGMFTLSRCKLPSNRRVGIITTTGGGGILLADKCEELGFEVPELRDSEKEAVSAVIPQFGSTLNPIDLTGQVIDDAESVRRSAAILLRSNDIDIVVLFLAMLKSLSRTILEGIKELQNNTEKLLSVIWVDPPEGAMNELHEHGILAFEDPVRCIKAINIAMKCAEKVRKNEVELKKDSDPISFDKSSDRIKEKVNRLLETLSRNEETAGEHEAKQILNLYDIPITREKMALSCDEAVKIAEQIGFPVALKIASPDIAHKTDVGGVRLDLRTPEAVRSSYNEIMSNIEKNGGPKITVKGILVQEMVQGAQEIFIGVKQDQIFGPVVLFGMGGIYTELLKDYSMRIAPISRTDAYDMIREIKGFQILSGLRRGLKADINGITETLFKVSQLAFDLRERVAEIDINPLFVFEEGKGVKIGDALIVLR
jgi:acetyltransferase